MASTLQEQLAAKKLAKEQAEQTGQKNGAEVGATTTTVPTQQAQEEKDQALKTTQQVAKEAGTVQSPGPGAPIQTGVQNSIVQSGAETDAQKQVERTEVDPHLTIVEEPRGSDLSAPNPPNGTLPNSNLVYNGEPGSVMEKHHQALTAALEQNKLSSEEEEKRIAEVEGELKRQRMLSGFPHDTDLAEQAEQSEKPEGGWKAIGLSRIVRANGGVFATVNGYFVPTNEEDEDQLEYFESKGLVERP